MFTARIRTESNNYLALENKGYGSYSIMWCDALMNPIKRGSTEEWLWACASWDSPVEQGKWNVESHETVYFGDFTEDEPAFKEKAKVHITGLSEEFKSRYLDATSIEELQRDDDDLDVINLWNFFQDNKTGFLCSLSPDGSVIFNHMTHWGNNEWSLDYFEFQYI